MALHRALASRTVLRERLRAFVLSSYSVRVNRGRPIAPIFGKDEEFSMAKAQVRLKQSGIRQPNSKHGEAAPSSSTPLNFKVPHDFRREFKTYAARHNKKLNQLLYEAFAALKAR